MRNHRGVFAIPILVRTGLGQNSTNTGVGDVIAGVIGATSVNGSSATQPIAVVNGTSGGAAVSAGLPVTSFPYSNPSPTWTVAASGTGSAYAVACNFENVLYSYLTESASQYGEKVASTSYTTVTSYTATVTTLCDGHERVLGSLTPVSTVTNSTLFSLPVTTNIPSPSCAVTPDDYTTYVSNPWLDASVNSPQTTLVVSLDASLTAVTINGSSTALPAATTAPKLTIDGTTFAANDESTYLVQIDWNSMEPYRAGDEFTMTQYGDKLVYDSPQLITASATQTADQSSITQPVSAGVGTVIAENTSTSTNCPCTIAGQNVRLLYFPVTSSASRDHCQTGLAQGTLCPYAGATVINAQNSLSIAIEEQVDQGSVCPYVPLNYTSTKNSGPYVVSSGTTFYENRVYLAFDVMSATRGCGYGDAVSGRLGTTDTLATTKYVGSTYTNGYIELPSSDLYSGCGYSYFYDAVGYSFNYADLNEPVPASAFLCQPACFEAVAYSTSTLQYGDYLNGQLADPGFCKIILESEYKPQLLVPPQARTLDPEWSTCVLKLEGLYDPPVALQQVVSEAVLTVPAGATTTGASPASTPTTQDAPQTSGAADNLPTTTPVAQASNNNGGSQSVAGPSTPTVQAPATQAQASQGQASSGNADPAASQAGSQAVSNSDPGSSAALSFTFAGSVYVASSAGASAVAIDPSTNNGPSQGQASAVVDGQTVQATDLSGRQSAVIVAGSSLSAGGAAVTVGNTVVSLASGGLVVGGTTNALPATGAASATQVGGQAVVPTTLAGGQSAVVVEGSTLSVGGSPITVSGTVVSLASGGLVVGGSTNALPVAGGASTTQINGQNLVQTTLAGGQTAVIVAGETLSAGGSAVTVSGTIISLASGGLVVGGTTNVLPPPGGASATNINGQAVMPTTLAGGLSAVIVDGVTLTAGGAAPTVSGAALSLGSSGLVVGGTQTVPLSSGSGPGSPVLPATTERPSGIAGPAGASSTTTSAASARTGVSILFVMVAVVAAIVVC
ncbi:hypothetical protein LTR86_009933 [Recurvomyces mirabilis]|nr:hypothetical protein LTR86_009933 [Recurvomyces mirabilis]